MSKTEIVALKYAESTIAENAVVQGGKKDVKLPISFVIYLIKTEDKFILADAGCTTMPGWDMKYFCSPAEVLTNYGINPEQIEGVILTHHHHDHIQAVELFKNATVYIQSDEYECCKNIIPKTMKVISFDDEYAVCNSIKIKKIGGHSKGSCVVFVNEYVICGDECYTKMCLDKKIPTGSTVDISKSTFFVEEYSKSKYKALLCHDYDILPGQNGWVQIV